MSITFPKMTYYFVAESHTFEFQPKYASEKSSLQLSIHTNSQLKRELLSFSLMKLPWPASTVKGKGGKKTYDQRNHIPR